VQIDPYAWLLTVPATIALVQIWFLPAEHAIKRLWRAMRDAEAEVWCRLHFGLWRPEPGSVGYTGWMSRPTAYQAVVAIFAVTSLLSFAAFVGVLPQ
jgi:hypothetical protein